MNTTLQISDDANERIQQFERYLDDEVILWRLRVGAHAH